MVIFVLVFESLVYRFYVLTSILQTNWELKIYLNFLWMSHWPQRWCSMMQNVDIFNHWTIWWLKSSLHFNNQLIKERLFMKRKKISFFLPTFPTFYFFFGLYVSNVALYHFIQNMISLRSLSYTQETNWPLLFKKIRGK